jgi:hypothetical protein
VTTNLKDVTDINNQLRQAKGQAAVLSTFFRSTATNTWSSNSSCFLAIPVNTALYGAESWTLNVELCRQISSFYHTTIHRIIRINMHHVAEYQIKNKHIRNDFSVPDPIDIIRKCQFILLGKFACMDPTRLPRKFLTAWVVSHPRHSGGQHYTLQNSYVETLQHILPNIPDNGTIDSWLPLAQNREQWKTLGLNG